MPLDLAGTGTVYSHGFGECVTYRGAGNMSCLTLTSHWSDEAVTRCRRTVVLHHSSGISIFGNPQPSPGKWKSLSLVWLFVTPWIITHQPPLSLGILQARILEWVAIPSSRGSSQPRHRTESPVFPALADGFFTVCHLVIIASPGNYLAQNVNSGEAEELWFIPWKLENFTNVGFFGGVSVYQPPTPQINYYVLITV